MKEKKRTYSCYWCKHLYEVAGLYPWCTLNPEWLPIEEKYVHFCGQHDWNSTANKEIRGEVFSE